MNTITQTNRTILFEEINPEKLNLLTLVGDVRGVNSVSDDKIKEINDALLVRSFDEFLEKFEPVVYSYFDANNQKVIYTLKKPENIEEELLSEIHLNRQNDYLKMLMTLVEAKRAEGSINVDFKFENLTDMISPKKVMDDIRQNRKELQYTYGEYAKLEDGDPKKLDIADKLNLMFEEAKKDCIRLIFAGCLPGDVTSGNVWDYSDVMVSFKKVGDDIYTYWGKLKDVVLLYSDQVSGKIYFTRTDAENNQNPEAETESEHVVDATETGENFSEMYEIKMEQASLKKIEDGYELALYDKSNKKFIPKYIQYPRVR